MDAISLELGRQSSDMQTLESMMAQQRGDLDRVKENVAKEVSGLVSWTHP
jgi:hypothetical protein